MSNKGNLYILYEAFLDAVPSQEGWFEEFELDLTNLKLKTTLDISLECQNLANIGWLEILARSDNNSGKARIKIICPPTYGLQKYQQFLKDSQKESQARRLSKKIVDYQSQEDERLLPKLWQSTAYRGEEPDLLYSPPTDTSLLNDNLLIGRRELVLELKNKLEAPTGYIVSLVSQLGQLGVGKTKLVGWFLRRLMEQKNSKVGIYWVKFGSQVSITDIIIDFLTKIESSTESKKRTDYVSMPAPQVFQKFINTLQARAYLIIIDNLDRGLGKEKSNEGMQLLLKMLMEKPIGNSRVILISDQLPRKQTAPTLQIPPFSEEETRQFLFDQDVSLSQQEIESVMRITLGNPLALKLGRRRWANKELNLRRPAIRKNPAATFIHNAFEGLNREDRFLTRVVAALAKSESSSLNAIKDIMFAYQGLSAKDIETRLEDMVKTQFLLTKNVVNGDEPVYGMHPLIKEHVLEKETDEDEREDIHERCLDYFLTQADQGNSEDPLWLSAALHAFFGNHYQQLSKIISQRLSMVVNVDGAYTYAAFLGGEKFSRGDVDRWEKSVCRFCGVGCGIMLGISADKKLVAIEGDKKHPSTQGMLCGKALALPHIVASKDRLTTPQIRKNDKLEDATWDEAMDLVSKKFAMAIKEYGTDSVAYYGSGQALSEESYLAARLFRGGIGTNNVDGNPRLCMASAVGGYMTTYGLDEPMGSYADIEHAKTFFFIGSNIAECHPVIWYLIRAELIKDKSKRIIILDPRKIPNVSEHNPIYLNLAPGSDVVVLNAMAYVIVNESLHKKQFIDDHTVFYRQDEVGGEKKKLTFEDYKAFLNDFVPEKVEAITGLPADKIIQAARQFASGPTTSMWSMGLNQHTTGVWGNNLVHNLHLLTGNIGIPGGTPLSLTGQPNACGGVRDGGALAHLLPYGRLITNKKHRQQMEVLWGAEKGKIPPKPGFHTIDIFQAMEKGKLKALLVLTTNPGQSLPNLNRYRKAMEQKGSFMVVIDAYPTRTTELADVVLPAAMWSEKTGVYGMTERRYQLMPQVLDPPGQARSDFDILLDLAERLEDRGVVPKGYIKGKFKTTDDVWDEMRKASEDTPYNFMGMTRRRLEKEHGICWPTPTEDHPGTNMRYVKGKMGKMGDGDPILDNDSSLKEGDIKFYGNSDGKAIIWLRPVKFPDDFIDGKLSEEYPYVLSTGRVLEHWHTGSMTMKSPKLERSKPLAFVEINTSDARELGIQTGDRVRITSQRGEAIISAKVVDTIRPGSVFVPFHWEDEDSMINKVTADAIDPISKQPEFKVGAVRLEKA